jgi:drug/metabolite transporter (DMT)-like permease
VVVGGAAQVVATGCLLMAATLRNFAVATAYSKTEPILAALLGLLLLSEPVGPAAVLGISISVGGVVGLGFARGGVVGAPGGFLSRLLDRGAVLGIACGALFGLAAVSYRGASLSLQVAGHPEAAETFLLRSTFTLSWVLVFQTLLGGVYLRLREPGELGRIFRAWRPSVLVGLTGAAASVGWFSAVTLENAAYVRTLGQVELLFALGSSRFLLGERMTRGEILGILTILIGLLLLIAVR